MGFNSGVKGLTGYNVPYPLPEEPRTKPRNIIPLKYTKGVS